MADYDVAAVALASPPQSTPPATYTPAIYVKNNGLHDATASGWLSFYRKSTGVLVAQFNVASGTIHPGATGNATATGTLDLSAEPVGAQFVVTGYVTTANDQVPGNDPLAPLTITISAEPPPPPPPVEAHASQHEAEGNDTISVEGLTGKLADAQQPTAHAADHEETGGDELNVDGLHGALADAQTPSAHHSTHEPGGSDAIAGIEPGPHAATHGPEGGDPVDVTGMPGLLADDQNPTTHDNDRHSTEYIDGYGCTEIANGVVEGHNLDTNPHDAATSLEHSANKGAAEGYAPLDAAATVPTANLGTGEPSSSTFLRGDKFWAPVPTAVVEDGPSITPKLFAAQGTASKPGRSDFQPNTAGIGKLAEGAGTVVHSGAYAGTDCYFSIPAATTVDFALIVRCGGEIAGQAALSMRMRVNIHDEHHSYNTFERDFTTAPGSEGDHVIHESIHSFKYRNSSEKFFLDAQGFVLFPAEEGQPDQVRYTSRAVDAIQRDDDIHVHVKLFVLDGSVTEGLRPTSVLVLLVPGFSDPAT
jgi:hypothetical protein